MHAANRTAPRLIAAGADLDRVYRVEVIADDVHTELTLPRDLGKMRDIAHEVDAVLLIFDPLLSRLDDRLDTHKDADVLEDYLTMNGGVAGIRQDEESGTFGRAHRALDTHLTDAPQGRNLGTRVSAPNVVALAWKTMRSAMTPQS